METRKPNALATCPHILQTINWLLRHCVMPWIPFSRALGGRRCAKARRALAEMSGLGRKLSPNIRYFVAILRVLDFFGQRSVFLGQKQCFSGKKCTVAWYILYFILSCICRFTITCKIDAFVAKIVNTCLTKIFTVIFALPTSATLLGRIYIEPSFYKDADISYREF